MTDALSDHDSLTDSSFGVHLSHLPMSSFNKFFSFLIIYSKKGACLNYPITVQSSRQGKANWNESLALIGRPVWVHSVCMEWCVYTRIAYEVNGPKEAMGRWKWEWKWDQGLRQCTDRCSHGSTIIYQSAVHYIRIKVLSFNHLLNFNGRQKSLGNSRVWISIIISNLS